VFDTLRQHSVTEVSVDMTRVTVVDRHGSQFLATKRLECSEEVGSAPGRIAPAQKSTLVG
jgi:hypothetical protein